VEVRENGFSNQSMVYSGELDWCQHYCVVVTQEVLYGGLVCTRIDDFEVDNMLESISPASAIRY
jgi:hypothetical protein